MKSKLSSLCSYRKGKIAVSELDSTNYISTENMLADKGGITKSSGLPASDFTQVYYKNDVLVSNIRPYFKKIWFANMNGGCSNDVLVFTANNECEPSFLYYVLSNDDFFNYATVTAKGTKMPRGDKKAIMEYEVPIYDIDTQKKIASILSVLDEKIELNQKINENLEQQAQLLFIDTFIKNISSEWKNGNISDLGTVVGGATPSKAKSEYYTENGIAWITPKDLSLDKSKFISKGQIDITESGFKSCSVKIMPKGTVLFSSRAPIGYIAISSNEVTTNQGFKSIIPHEHIGTPYVYFFLKHNLNLIENMASGSTFKEISGSIMKNIPAIIPDEESLSRFNDFCNPIFKKQEDLEHENSILSKIRDTLLPKLMNGEIDVSDIKI